MKNELNKLTTAIEKLSQQRHICAVKDGMVALLPIILIGSFFLLLYSFDDFIQAWPSVKTSSLGLWYSSNKKLFLLPYLVTTKILGLFLCISVSYHLAQSYQLSQPSSSIVALAAFLVTSVPEKVSTSSKTAWVLDLHFLDASSMFLAIAIAIISVEITRITLSTKQEDTDQKNSMPEAVKQAFLSLIPLSIIFGLLFILHHIIGLDLHALFTQALEPINRLGDSLIAVWASNFFLHLSSFTGVHGISLINAVMLPIWQGFLVKNSDAFIAGQPLTHITAFPFFQWFIWIGGAGATLAPTILCLFSSKSHYRSIGWAAILPAIFNINEPFIFGLPVVMNPRLIIPFILSPLICGTIAYMAFAQGWVHPVYIEVPWITPSPIGAYLSTQDWRALVLWGINFAVSLLVWWPFMQANKSTTDEGSTT